jgi:hypothetical protein
LGYKKGCLSAVKIHKMFIFKIKNLFLKNPSPPVVLSPQLDAYLVSQMIGAAIVSTTFFGKSTRFY